MLSYAIGRTSGSRVYQRTASSPKKREFFYACRNPLCSYEPTFQVTTIQVSKRTSSCPPVKLHTHPNSAGLSYVVALGDCRGGGDLLVEGRAGPVNFRRKFASFDGKACAHGVSPHSHGTRFSILLFSFEGQPHVSMMGL